MPSQETRNNCAMASGVLLRFKWQRFGATSEQQLE